MPTSARKYIIKIDLFNKLKAAIAAAFFYYKSKTYPALLPVAIAISISFSFLTQTQRFHLSAFSSTLRLV